MHNCKEMPLRQATPYITRSLEKVLRTAAREFPAVVLTGPRQSGKTTLLRQTFGDTHRYVSLETPDIRAAAAADPRGFLAMYPPPVVFDEVQYAPELLPYIKEAIDERRTRRGQFLLTGSQNLLLASSISESLAGRAAILRMLTLSQREIAGQPARQLPWESSRPANNGVPSDAPLWPQFLRGCFPELVTDPSRNISLWHASYVHTYLERDVRGLRQIGDLVQFQSFLHVLAGRSGQLLNLTDISRDLGVAVNTVKAWLSVLEATYQVIVLRPYFANTGKRLVKTPKVYFTDTGTLCYLVGLKTPEHASAGPMAGSIFETAVITEVFKTHLSRGEDPQMFFWRTSDGKEVDLIVETDGMLVPIEIKSTATPRPAMTAGIEAFRKNFPRKSTSGFVIHTGNIRLPMGRSATALPYREL
jgi:predicted AAA+ superfamily ATPase